MPVFARLLSPTRPRTVRTALLRALRAPVVATAFAAAYAAAMPHVPVPALPAVVGPGQVAGAPGMSTPRGQGATGAQRVAELVARHGCWRFGERAPVAVPGHVVVSRPGADRVRYTGRAQVLDAALDQVFSGAESGLVVHAFCR